MIEDRFACVLTTKLNGKTVLRICAIHPDATEADMRNTIHLLNHYANETGSEYKKQNISKK